MASNNWPKSENVGTNTSAIQLAMQIDQLPFHTRQVGATEFVSSQSTNARFLMTGGLHTTAAPTLADGQVGALRLTADGKLMVDATAIIGGIAIDAAPPGVQHGDSLTIFGSTDPATYDPTANKNVLAAKIAADGRLMVEISSGTPLFYANMSTTAQGLIKGSPGKALAFSCFNLNASLRYFQLHNVIVPLVGGEVPFASFPIPTGQDVILGTDFFTTDGTTLSTGITWGFSTTATTFTTGAAGDQITHVTYT